MAQREIHSVRHSFPPLPSPYLMPQCLPFLPTLQPSSSMPASSILKFFVATTEKDPTEDFRYSDAGHLKVTPYCDAAPISPCCL